MIAGCFFPLRRGSATEADDGLTSSDMVMDCAKIELVVKRREGSRRESAWQTKGQWRVLKVCGEEKLRGERRRAKGGRRGKKRCVT